MQDDDGSCNDAEITEDRIMVAEFLSKGRPKHHCGAPCSQREGPLPWGLRERTTIVLANITDDPRGSFVCILQVGQSAPGILPAVVESPLTIAP